MPQLKGIRRWFMTVAAMVVLTAFGGISVAAGTYSMRATVDRPHTGPFAKNQLPPEIQALIGLKIPQEMRPVNVRNKATGIIETSKRLMLGHIPNFFQVSSGVVDIGFIGQTPAFVVLKLTPMREREILNIEVLHAEHLNMQLVDGKLQWGKGLNDVFDICKQTTSTSSMDRYDAIVALGKPEVGNEDCEHTTRQIKLAWGVDTRTGRIEVIAPETVECLLPAPTICK